MTIIDKHSAYKNYIFYMNKFSYLYSTFIEPSGAKARCSKGFAASGSGCPTRDTAGPEGVARLRN